MVLPLRTVEELVEPFLKGPGNTAFWIPRTLPARPGSLSGGGQAITSIHITLA
jgi:hypothetical protein